MITQALMDFGAGFVVWFASLFPTFEVPGWFVGLSGTVNGFFDRFAGFGVWAPWGLVSGCVVAALAVWVACAAIKALRAVASYLPFVGGAG